MRTIPASFENYAEAFALDPTGESLALGDIGRVRVFAVDSGRIKAETPLVSDPVSVSFTAAEPELDSGELLLNVLRDHSVVRIQVSSGRPAGRVRTTNLAAIDATSEDLQSAADTSGGVEAVVTSSDRSLYLTNVSLLSVIKNSCRRFARELSPTERLRFSIADEIGAPCAVSKVPSAKSRNG